MLAVRTKNNSVKQVIKKVRGKAIITIASVLRTNNHLKSSRWSKTTFRFDFFCHYAIPSLKCHVNKTPLYSSWSTTTNCVMEKSSRIFNASTTMSFDWINFDFCHDVFAVNSAKNLFSFNILRMSPSVMIPITLSCSITAVTPRRFSEISKSLFLSAYQENHRF
jgi:hypothetical protein